jgi:hypothetical protein
VSTSIRLRYAHSLNPHINIKPNTIALGYWKLARLPVSIGVWVSLSRTVYLGLRLGLRGVTVRPSMALTAAPSTNCRNTIALGYWKLARLPVSIGVWVSLSRTVHLDSRLGLGGVTVLRPSMALTAALSTNMSAVSSRHPDEIYFMT